MKLYQSVPFGYYWSLATVSVVPLVPQTTQTVPDHILLTFVQPSASVPRVEQYMNVGTGCSGVTDDESDMDYKSENDSEYLTFFFIDI